MKNSVKILTLLGAAVGVAGPSGCAYMKNTLPAKNSDRSSEKQWDEKHQEEGYFLKHDDAEEQGGVGNYVPRRSAEMREPRTARATKGENYYVSNDEARARGGVGNYVPRTGWKTARTDEQAWEKESRHRHHWHNREARVDRERFEPKAIHFEVGSAELTADARDQVQSLAQQLKDRPEQKLEIIGFADSTGDASYNEDLSKRRAAAVRSYLEESGVSGDRIQVVGRGESNPVASNSDEAGRAQNRRVEVRTG